MKAARFDYLRATSIDEACQALADGAGEARIIAGGQTLVPLMAMRLARPALLIDVNRIADLAGIALDGDTLAIRACTRQADALAAPLVRENLPLLADALSHVGHGQTRNRGTIGGSLCNADPSAEIALVAQTLEAELVARSVRGERRLKAAEFLESAMMTALAPDECLIEARFPVWRDRAVGHGFHEVSIRESDFALGAAAAQLALDGAGNCARLHVAIAGATPAAMRLPGVEAALTGGALEDAAIADACAGIADLVDPQSDVHADAAYRRRVAGAMARRAIVSARDAARKQAEVSR